MQVDNEMQILMLLGIRMLSRQFKHGNYWTVEEGDHLVLVLLVLLSSFSCYTLVSGPITQLKIGAKIILD